MRRGAKKPSSAAGSIKPTVPSSAAFHFGTSFIYIESSASQLRAVQLGNGFLALLVVRHLHKRESTRPSGIAIRHHRHSIHLAELCEKLTKVIFSNVEIEMPDKDGFHDEARAENL
ncbi:MAG TPA: hypothetical protein VL156_17655 [Terriglobales bacterium]|jgi:hypothetical protein|nr:hypothetical protein [Terriglobales bacterium]